MGTWRDSWYHRHEAISWLPTQARLMLLLSKEKRGSKDKRTGTVDHNNVSLIHVLLIGLAARPMQRIQASL